MSAIIFQTLWLRLSACATETSWGRAAAPMTLLCSSRVDNSCFHPVSYDERKLIKADIYYLQAVLWDWIACGYPHCPIWITASWCYWSWQRGGNRGCKWVRNVCEGKTDNWRFFNFLSVSVSPLSGWGLQRVALSKIKTPDQSRVESQVMVHQSVVKVLGFAFTPPTPSFAGGGQCGWLWAADG